MQTLFGFNSGPTLPENEIENDPHFAAPTGGANAGDAGSSSGAGCARINSGTGGAGASSGADTSHQTHAKQGDDWREGEEEVEVLLRANCKRERSTGIRIEEPSEALIDTVPLSSAGPQTDLAAMASQSE